MDISSFDDLLQAARMQPETSVFCLCLQRLNCPTMPLPAQRARALKPGRAAPWMPLMCVDKTRRSCPSFSALVEEARQFTAPGHDWAMVFAAALSGTLNQAPAAPMPRRPAAHGRCHQGRRAWCLHSV